VVEIGAGAKAPHRRRAVRAALSFLLASSAPMRRLYPATAAAAVAPHTCRLVAKWSRADDTDGIIEATDFVPLPESGTQSELSLKSEDPTCSSAGVLSVLAGLFALPAIMRSVAWALRCAEYGDE
jgi:hypothetical protein